MTIIRSIVSIIIPLHYNIGFYTQNIASTYKRSSFSKIISIEPNPILVKRLNDNLSLLQNIIPEIENKIITENYAIGSTVGEIFLDLNEGYGNARIIDDKKTTAIKCINAFLNTKFEGGRHTKRVKKI